MQPGADQIGEAAPRLPRHLQRWGLAALLLAVVALRVAAVFTVAVNWDEFALLKGADLTAESGTLYTGGRPGLAVVLLVPLVQGCDDEIQVIRRARLLWLAITFAFLAGLAAMLAQLQEDPRRRWGDAVLGVALLACVPAFLEWSIQVRTDQIALAGGAWGGAALLASRRSRRSHLHLALALGSGLLFGIGYLSSQKLVYAGALASALALGQLVLARDLRPRRDAARALLCLAGFGLVLFAFRAAVASQLQVPEIHASQQVMPAAYLSRGLSVFDFYRKSLGYSQYRAMLPSLFPHFLLLGSLAAVSVAALRRRSAALGRLALAWAVLALGAAVGAFHAAAFFYFWMTLGLFPAVAFAVAREPIAQLLRPAGARAARLLLVGWWLLLAAPALMQMAAMLNDTQSVQRESLAFIHRNFGSADAGFHPESALFCRLGPQPIPTHFSETIYRRFAGSERERNSAQMIETFREQPIAFILHSFRLNQFPVELRRFWAENYQPYNASVLVAGRRLEGRKGSRSEFGLFVPGAYRWLPFTGSQPLQIEGRLLAPGEVASFEPGEYTAEFVEDVPGGMLVLSLHDPPGAAPRAFYKMY